MVFGIPSDSLKEYHAAATSKKYKFDMTPPENLRLVDEEIKSAAEYDRESEVKKKDLSVVDESDEFVFVNSRSHHQDVDDSIEFSEMEKEKKVIT